MSGASMLFHPNDHGQPIHPRIVEQAVHWLVTLQSGVATPEEQQACAHWRQHHPDHERAWQRLSGLGQDVRSGAAGMSAFAARQTLRGAGRTRRIVLKSVAGFAATGWGMWMAREQTPWQVWVADHHAATGERRTVVLADGTQLVLGSQSAVDVQFDDQQRLVVLRTGNVMVTTGKDPAKRPLVVVTGSGSIRPIGTRFTVRYEPHILRDVTRVAVIEGAVNVSVRARDATLLLRAGQQTSFTSDMIDAPVSLQAGAVAWVDGMLVAERMRLSDFVVELGRYRPGLLRCDPAVADMLVSGAFPLDAPESVLAMLQEILPVQVRYMTRYWATIGTV
jgi:transmembrane sensor